MKKLIKYSVIYFNMGVSHFSIYVQIVILSTKIIPMFVSNFVSVDEILIREEVLDTYFACDLEKCKGACCTFESDFGAPLQDDEIPLISQVLDKIKEYLPEKNRNVIELKGFCELKEDEYFTRSIDKKDCVFVYYDGDIAKCSIEKAYLEGKIKFRKPISCHLFPIRTANFGGDVLRFEEFKHCSHALEKGENEKIRLIDFCKESIIRLLGKIGYDKLKEISGI